MRIGINLLYLRVNEVGGSEIYVRNVIDGLARIPGNEIIVFGWAEAAHTFGGSSAVTFVPVIGGRFSQVRRLFAENVTLESAVAAYPIDVLFSPANFAAPLLRAAIPQVATIHDLQHVHYPSYFALHQRALRTILFRATGATCRELIAISEFTRRDYVNAYGAPRARMTVVHQGVTDAARPAPSECERVRARYGLPGPYLYYPAMLAPHKNHERLLDAFGGARTHVDNLTLVLTGARADQFASLQGAIESRGLRAHVRHLGFVDRTDVLPLMASATALVFPSLFEGFGLPVLEAMQLGVPVVASSATSIPEVAGDAAVLLPPDDVEGWKQALVDIVGNEALRQDVAARGLRRAKEFSWERCALETQAVLERSSRGRPERKTHERASG